MTGTFIEITLSASADAREDAVAFMAASEGHAILAGHYKAVISRYLHRLERLEEIDSFDVCKSGLLQRIRGIP